MNLIIDRDEAKLYLRIDGNEDDILLDTLIAAAEEYIKNATGKEFDNSNRLAKLLCLVLITDWYENRAQTDKISEKYRFTVQTILGQLKYRPEEEAGDGDAGEQAE